MTLGNRIRNRREELGMTQIELAKSAKLSQGHISKTESGSFVPKDSTLIVLAVALRLEPEELLGMKSNQIIKKEKKAS